MIPRAFITEWQHSAPWPGDEQIEQDLILSRVLVDIYQNEYLQDQLLFRGGTALNKLFFPEPVRYSEDLDFVQKRTGPIKNIVETIQGLIDPWLGKSKTQARRDGFRILYSFTPENDPEGKKRIKIEINTREHFTVFPIKKMSYGISSGWYSDECELNTYHLDELLATKLRALYQRRKGRDLFDLDWAIRNQDIDHNKIVTAFKAYMKFHGNSVTAKQYLLNLEEKMKDYTFRHDLDHYLRIDVEYNLQGAFENVKQLVNRI
ncbi:MAG: nucleotidyl transferase AbiEii/AbiGii toxin family protein [Candidatus Neomarinimicrobiota bacterium]|nr:MAG: nucleotidyl transferase AbiEii/AbiGii toxin family protein [Candidatus Neomarinimicrobiota bacterium]